MIGHKVSSTAVYRPAIKRFCFSSIAVIVFFSCQQQHTPKPSGYFRIETGEHHYQKHHLQEGGVFSYSQQAMIIPLAAEKKGEEWFDIHYRAFQADIHCSYLKISANDFSGASEDSRNFVYRHSTKAENIDMKLFYNETDQVYGTLYEIEGKVASPIQFTLSDSVTFFFRGALYFNESIDRDSVAPVLEFIREDIRRLMDSFRKE